MNNYLDQIRNQESVRQTLIDLKSAIKDHRQKKALAYKLAGDFSVFTNLLSSEDPKIRKNAVLILGEMECNDLIHDIWNAYIMEETLFIKADYLKSLSNYDCKELLSSFKKRMKELTDYSPLPEEEKHLRAEISALQNLISRYSGNKTHRFTGFSNPHLVILITNRNHREATANQIADGEIKYMSGGIRVKTTNLEDILKIRTYAELLFPVPGVSYVEGDPDVCAQAMAKKILAFLSVNHSGEAPFYFRTDVRGITDKDQKTALMKKLAIALEKASNRRLLNATSGYEVEIRMIANKKGQFVPVLKLFTLGDSRFSYRKESLPTSIAPVNAALILELTKDYLKENAQVLDPFCGVGTMLIERCRISSCSSVYGLDILEEAIVKARGNTDLAKLPIHYINRDYFDFRHEYLFDELITNMPAVGKTRDADDMQYLYNRFFEKSEQILKDSAILILYTSMPELLQNSIRQNPAYRILTEYILNEREGSICYVIKYQKS